MNPYQELLRPAYTVGVERPRAPVVLTQIKVPAPAVCTKRFTVGPDGQLKKDTLAKVHNGTMRRVTLDGLQGLAHYLFGLTPDSCNTYGLPPRDAGLVTESEWVQLGRPDDPLPRSKAVFTWPESAGVLMLDYDAPKDGTTPLTSDELVALVLGVCPDITKSGFIWWPSTSSHLFVDGVEVQGLRGQRLYVIVSSGQDIERAGRVINDRLWAQGHGRFEPNDSGSMLERPIFDGSVWQTNRIDFAAGADCGRGVEQRRGAPIVTLGEDVPLDTLRALPDLTGEEVRAVEAAKNTARELVRPEAERMRAAWVAARVDAVISANPRMDRSVARAQVLRAVEGRDLAGDYLITVRGEGSRPQVLTVGEALDNPHQWHGRQTLDPLEPGYDGGRYVGKLYLYGARPCIHSMAHGGATFRLSRQPEQIEVAPGCLSETVDMAANVLQKTPDVFNFGSEIVTAGGEDGTLHVLNTDGLRYVIGHVAQFWQRKGDVRALMDPPVDVCKALLALGAGRNLKNLVATVSAPTLRPDGTVLDQPGFDAATGILYVTSEATLDRAVPMHPTKDQARQALRTLWRPFEAFPFCGPSDRAVHLAALLTAAVRPTLPTAPGFGYDAPNQGSGKSLLARCVGIMASGALPLEMPHTAGRDDEETRKRLFTVLRTGKRAIVWDNVTGQYDSAAMATFLTSPEVTDRVLGVSSVSTLVNRSVFCMTGNNLTLAGELPRRIMVCRIDPQTDQPFARSFDLDPAAHCLAHRQSMISAALTLIRAQLTHGCRVPGVGQLGSFEAWDRVVRQTVIFADELNPGSFGDVMDVVKAAQAQDPEQEVLDNLMAEWVAVVGREWVSARDVMRKAFDRESPLFLALNELARNPSTLTADRVGKFLRYRLGRIVGGNRLESRNGPHKTKQWRVASVQNSSKGLT